MEWLRTNFDWDRAKAFFVAAEEGSLSAAARALDMAQPTIGRQVSALEDELGVTLIERVAHGIELTPTGLELVEHVRAMSDAANRIALIAEGHSVSLEGVVCITASEMISAHILPPILKAIRQDYPGIELDVVASNQPSDLRRREADIAVRNFQPTDPELVARKVRESGAYLYAAPDYLETIGPIESPADLSRADFIGFDRTDALMEGLNALGLDLTAENFPIVTESQIVQWELVKRGTGIGIMMEEVGEPEPLVERALPSLAPIRVPMWLTSHRAVRTSRRVRVIFDLLAEGLQRE
jgi:DNA-binding transcriptional LysR family regulator